MKRRINKLSLRGLIFAPALLILAVFFVCKTVQAEDKIFPGEIIINELMWMGLSGTADNEWLELFNPTDHEIRLDGCVLKKKNGGSALKSGKSLEGDILPGSYLIVSYKEKTDLKFEVDAQAVLGRYALSNDELQISLECGGALIDMVGDGGKPLAGENGEIKKSMERIDSANDGKLSASWQTCYVKANMESEVLDCATPGVINSQKPDSLEDDKGAVEDEDETNEKVETIASGEVRINEIFPNPIEKGEKKEYIELYNFGTMEIFLEKLVLRDKNGNECLLEGKIEAGKFLVIENKIKENCAVILRNSNERIILFDTAVNKEISKVEFFGSAKENVSYNFDGARWRWSKFLTPGRENIFNNEPYGKVKIDKEVFAGVYADFEISVGDLDGEKVKVVWDFGDGHKSYLAKTRHKFETEGVFTGSVKLADDSESVVKNFTVKVKNFPHPEVHIVSILPNPKGDDSLGEKIAIQNKSKKKINLKGWSIATGWKNLYNHPILEDFFLKKNEIREITREFSKFVLNNTKDKIELRYPDGEVAYRVKYKSPNKTIAEEEVYQKVKGKGWEWKDNEQETISKEQKISNIQNITDDIQDINNKNVYLENSEEEIVIENYEISFLPKNKIELAVAEINGKPLVLGAEKIREENAKYFFTPVVLENEHYILAFSKSIFAQMNSIMNLLLNYFFQ